MRISPRGRNSQERLVMKKKPEPIAPTFKKVSEDLRLKLFKTINHGKFMSGGVFGGKLPAREPSPRLTDSDNKFGNYPHCQADPIIIRGESNVDPNHLVIRNKYNM